MRTRGATGSQPQRWRLQSLMSRRLHRRGLQFLTPLIVAGAAAQLADEGDGARDYEREYEQGFTEASADKQERALEVIEIIAMLENVTLEAVGRTLAAFVVAHAAVLTTIAIVVRPTQAGSSVRRNSGAAPLSVHACFPGVLPNFRYVCRRRKRYGPLQYARRLLAAWSFTDNFRCGSRSLAADEPKQPISRRKRNDRYYSSSKYD